MPVELEQLTANYEFEDRAAFFIAEIEKVAKRFTSSRVEVENLTFERSQTLEQRIKEQEKTGKDKLLLKKLREMEYGFQIESANENRVIILFYTHSSRSISRFGSRADEIAKAYRGVKIKEESNVYDFDDDDAFKFVASFVYKFRNDFKKYKPCQK